MEAARCGSSDAQYNDETLRRSLAFGTYFDGSRSNTADQLWQAVGIVVVLVWLYTPRRYSLRTLLIATTLVAVALGLIVWACR